MSSVDGVVSAAVPTSAARRGIPHALQALQAIVMRELFKFSQQTGRLVSALVQIDYETVGKWAQERRLAYTTYRSLSQLPEVRELVDAEVRRVNKLFARVENIRKFVILEKELDHDDGELTATQKVRRSIIGKKFAREIELIYGGGTA